MKQGARTRIDNVHRQWATACRRLGIPVQVRRRKYRNLHRVCVGAAAERLLGFKHSCKGARLIERVLHRKPNAQPPVRKRPGRPSGIFRQCSECGRRILASKNIYAAEVDDGRGIHLDHLFQRIETTAVGRHLANGKCPWVWHGQGGHRVIGKIQTRQNQIRFGWPLHSHRQLSKSAVGNRRFG